MIRHFFLFAAAPGRQLEAEQALSTWMSAAGEQPLMRGGAVLRARAGEFGEFQPPIAVTYDVDSRESGRALKVAMQGVPNPMATDVPGAEPPDQGAVLFADSDAHQHGNDYQHQHDHAQGDGHGHAHPDPEDHERGEPGHAHLQVTDDAISMLQFDRGGGLLCRLLHAHLELITQVQPAPVTSRAGLEK